MTLLPLWTIGAITFELKAFDTMAPTWRRILLS